MYQRAFTEVILRVLGLIYLYGVLEGIAATGLLVQASNYMRAIGEDASGLLAVSIFFFCLQVLISFLLVLGAKPLSRFIFKSEEKVFDSDTLTVGVIIKSIIPIMGLYLMVMNLPLFLSTLFAWFQERIDSNPLMPSQYNTAMARYTVSMFIAAVFIFKAGLISRILLKLLGESEQVSVSNTDCSLHD